MSLPGPRIPEAPIARHGDLAGGRWHTLSLLEQMANIGSGVDRALRAVAGIAPA